MDMWAACGRDVCGVCVRVCKDALVVFEGVPSWNHPSSSAGITVKWPLRVAEKMTLEGPHLQYVQLLPTSPHPYIWLS